jgi:hypothetical protein
MYGAANGVAEHGTVAGPNSPKDRKALSSVAVLQRSSQVGPRHRRVLVGGFEHIERELQFVVTDVSLELEEFNVAPCFC